MTFSVDHVLARTSHRPWPLPTQPWVLAQDWNELLFAHWPVSPEAIRRLVPATLELDLFEGSAWVAATPFRMSGVRVHFSPPVPGLSAFPEINVRTYVRYGDFPGVWFFTLDCASAVAAAAARSVFHLPYHHSEIEVQSANGRVSYKSRRVETDAPPAEFVADYGPAGDAAEATDLGGFAAWATERYCLYGADGDSLYRCDIHHAPWRLRPAGAEIHRNSIVHAAGVHLPETPPTLHFAERQEVLTWMPARVGAAGHYSPAVSARPQAAAEAGPAGVSYGCG
jgi:uncharacterized protein YqjF (DUF2071 family)